MKCTSELDLDTISPLLIDEILKHVVIKIYHKKTLLKNIPEILEYNVDYASSKGDGYLGVIYRITVKVSNYANDIKIIGKGMPSSIARRKLCRIPEFFKREIYFYSKILPAFQEMEQKYRLDKKFEDESFLNVPECYYTLNDGDNDFILMEDLNDADYAMNERSKPLEKEQIISMIKTVARLHAFSYALKQKDNEKYLELSKDVDDLITSPVGRAWIEKYLLSLTRIYYDAIKNTELNNVGEYMAKFTQFINPDAFFDNFIKCRTITDPFDNVFCHGDPWMANFMFNSVNNQCKAIDFQIVRIGSPMLDLSTIILVGTNETCRQQLNGIDGLLKIYQNELNNVLIALQCDAESNEINSVDKLKELWKSIGRHGLTCCMELVTLQLAETDDIADVDQLSDETAKGNEKVVSDEEFPVGIEALTESLTIKKQESRNIMAGVIKFAVDEGLI